VAHYPGVRSGAYGASKGVKFSEGLNRGGRVFINKTKIVMEIIHATNPHIHIKVV
jgi:hypothetical protein